MYGFHLDFSFIVSILSRISHLKACTHTLEKRCFSLYITLPMILQIGGVGYLYFGINRATSADSFNDAEVRSGKFDFFYQWRNCEISVTAWKNTRKEGYTQSNKNPSARYSGRPAQAVTCGTVAIIIVNLWRFSVFHSLQSITPRVY